MMDMKILSTLGLTEDDIKAIGAVEGVEKVEPGYMIDVLALMGESERVLHVESLPETMNQVDVDEGRLPEKKGEDVYKRQTYITKQAKDMGMELPFLGSDGWDGVLGTVTDTATVEGAIFLSPFFAADPSENVAAFVKSYEEAYSATPDQFAADAYDTVYTIKAAMELSLIHICCTAMVMPSSPAFLMASTFIKSPWIKMCRASFRG